MGCAFEWKCCSRGCSYSKWFAPWQLHLSSSSKFLTLIAVRDGDYFFKCAIWVSVMLLSKIKRNTQQQNFEAPVTHVSQMRQPSYPMASIRISAHRNLVFTSI
ncbi:hypothetical protein AMTRI_Chr13g122070 [Amborella trichopoda]